MNLIDILIHSKSNGGVPFVCQEQCKHLVTLPRLPLLYRMPPCSPVPPADPVTSKAGGHVTFCVWGRALHRQHRRRLPSRRHLSDRRISRCSRCFLWQVIIVGTSAKAIKPEGWQHHLVGCYFDAVVIVAARFHLLGRGLWTSLIWAGTRPTGAGWRGGTGFSSCWFDVR